MKEKPLVSILILTYNHEQFIEQTLKCAFNQKVDFKIEIVLLDDCSSDNTVSIIKKTIQDCNINIHFERNAYNLGMLQNFKKAIALCKGKYIAPLAGDDYWQNPDRLQLQKDYFDNNPDCGFVHGDCDMLFHSKNKIVKDYHKLNEHEIFQGVNIFEKLLQHNNILAPSVCFRKDLFEKYIDLNYYSQNFLMEDYPMWLELSQHTKFGYINKSLVTYRVITNSLGHPENNKKKFDFLESYFNVKKHFINKYGCSDSVKRIIKEEYYLKRLKLAFATKSKDVAKESFYQIKNKRLDHYFYLVGTGNKLLHALITVYFKIVNKLKSNLT